MVRIGKPSVLVVIGDGVVPVLVGRPLGKVIKAFVGFKLLVRENLMDGPLLVEMSGVTSNIRATKAVIDDSSVKSYARGVVDPVGDHLLENSIRKPRNDVFVLRAAGARRFGRSGTLGDLLEGLNLLLSDDDHENVPVNNAPGPNLARQMG